MAKYSGDRVSARIPPYLMGKLDQVITESEKRAEVLSDPELKVTKSGIVREALEEKLNMPLKKKLTQIIKELKKAGAEPQRIIEFISGYVHLEYEIKKK